MSTLALQIRDAAYTRLVKAMGQQFKQKRRTPILPLQPDQIPGLGVFFIRDQMDPDGDPRVGPPRFVCGAIIGISIVCDAGDPDAADGACDGMLDAALNTLLCDGTFVALTDSTGEPLMEGIGPIVRSTSYPQDGDTYYVEARAQITCLYRCFFAPVAPNALLEVDVTVKPFQPVLGETDASLEIDLPSGTTPA